MKAACILFDLDGTLLDTAPDLANALNRLRRERGLAELPFAVIRPVVSHGAPGLLKVSFDVTPEDAAFAALRQRLLALYEGALAVETRPFPGMPEVLEGLAERSIPWGVVTNKPGWLTEPLLKALGLRERAICVVSGDTLPMRKPDPAPLLHASALAGVASHRCAYVGDAERDIEAGRRAGMATLVARFGYLGEIERPQEWGADAILDQPADLLDWLDQS